MLLGGDIQRSRPCPLVTSSPGQERLAGRRRCPRLRVRYVPSTPGGKILPTARAGQEQTRESETGALRRSGFHHRWKVKSTKRRWNFLDMPQRAPDPGEDHGELTFSRALRHGRSQLHGGGRRERSFRWKIGLPRVRQANTRREFHGETWEATAKTS